MADQMTYGERKAIEAATRDFYLGLGNSLSWGRVGTKARAAYIRQQEDMKKYYAEYDAEQYENGI